MDFCADLGVVVEDLCGGRQKVLKVDVTEQAFVNIGVLLKRRPCDIREAWSQVLELICVVVLCKCCTSGDVVVSVGRLDGLLNICYGYRVTQLEGWVYKARCHLGCGNVICVLIGGDPLCKVPGGSGGVRLSLQETLRRAIAQIKELREAVSSEEGACLKL